MGEDCKCVMLVACMDDRDMILGSVSAGWSGVRDLGVGDINGSLARMVMGVPCCLVGDGLAS